MSEPAFTATNCTNINSIQITENHSASSSIAMIDCVSFSGDIGDEITIQLGYVGDTATKFVGYVKEIHRSVPENTYSVVAYDKLVRASDFALVASNPDAPFTRQNIAMETLIGQLLAEAGLTSYSGDTTYFTLAIHNPVEIDVVIVYDYIKNLADLMAWNIWCDTLGTIHFKNRKPYVMDGSTGEIGDVADTPTGLTLTDTDIIDLTYARSEKNLRNRVVVRGEGVQAEASAVSPYLPAGFYKTAVLSAPQLIDDQSIAQESADINLNAFNHLIDTVSLTCIGNPDIEVRTVITLSESILGLSGNWYIFSNVMNVDKRGYVNQLLLRRQV